MGKAKLTDAQRECIRTLVQHTNLSKAQISHATGFSVSQVKRALRQSSKPPKKAGRCPLLSDEQAAELVAFISSSQEHRQMSFLELSVTLFDGQFGEYAIRSTLRRIGYHRYPAFEKPPISEFTRQQRLAFASEYRHWTYKDWSTILWSDETWVMPGRHSRIWVTRKPGEELDPTCIAEKDRECVGWMFRGCFSGSLKGPGVFWEADRRLITPDSYCERTVPIICDWIRLRAQEGRQLIMMQDWAPDPPALAAIEELRRRGIRMLTWPPNSPDLNPIESCWAWMRNWTSRRYGDDENPSYDILRDRVKEAWEVLPASFLQEQLATMSTRLQAVIDADGGHIPF